MEGGPAVRSPAVLRVAAVAAAAGGLLLRILMIPSGWGVLDGDEAIMGLMARAILDGEFPAFLWGQRYGGTAEAYLMAAVFGVTGPSTLGIRLVTLALAAAAALLTWRVGRRLLGPHAGAAAGLLVWLWPTANVFLSIRNRGFYWITIVAGLAFALAVLRLADRPNRRDAVIAGLAAGLGWWNAPQVVTFVIPMVVWVLVCARHTLRPLLTVSLPAALVGAAPWVVVQLREGIVSLDPPPLPPGMALSYTEHLETFAAKGLPMAFGLRLPWSEQWIPGGRPLYLLAVVALVGALAWRRPPLPVWLGLAVFPFVHAVSPLSHYVGEGRYLVYYVPFLALAAAAAVRHRFALPVLVVVLAGLTLHNMDTLGRAPRATAPDTPIPDDLGPLIDDFEERGLTAAYANYWLANRLTFEADERIKVGTLPPASSRRPRFDHFANRADRVAYVSPLGSVAIDVVRTDLTLLGVTWKEHEVGGINVIVPDRVVTPLELRTFKG